MNFIIPFIEFFCKINANYFSISNLKFTRCLLGERYSYSEKLLYRRFCIALNDAFLNGLEQFNMVILYGIPDGLTSKYAVQTSSRPRFRDLFGYSGLGLLSRISLAGSLTFVGRRITGTAACLCLFWMFSALEFLICSIIIRVIFLFKGSLLALWKAIIALPVS